MRRNPDFVIGEPTAPYMRRWWIIPRNRFANIYLHEFLRSDDDRALHDHPWLNASVLLRGHYWEHTATGVALRIAGDIAFRLPTTAHRIEISAPCVTLFLTGPRVREWGFHCPNGWVHWQKFTMPTAHGQIGRGCGQ